MKGRTGPTNLAAALAGLLCLAGGLSGCGTPGPASGSSGAAATPTQDGRPSAVTSRRAPAEPEPETWAAERYLQTVPDVAPVTGREGEVQKLVRAWQLERRLRLDLDHYVTQLEATNHALQAELIQLRSELDGLRAETLRLKGEAKQ